MRVNSSTEMLGIVCELFSRRISMTVGKAARLQGKTVDAFLSAAPKHIQEAVKLTARLHKRFLRGDYRHEPSDPGKLHTLCNWLAALHAKTSGGDEKPVEFPNSMETKIVLGPNTYAAVAQKIRSTFG